MIIESPASARCDEVGRGEAPRLINNGPSLVPSKTSSAISLAIFFSVLETPFNNITSLAKLSLEIQLDK